MKTRTILSLTMLIAATSLLSACDTEKIELLKSPCAGTEGSPCGPKRDVNGWWLHHQPKPVAEQV